jgi:AcrR family transcriptional regulator
MCKQLSNDSYYQIMIRMEPGLRQRKRLQTMLRAQDAAYRLARVHGYEDTTIEAVAAAAEVSPATIYRHFGDKVNLFVWDPLEPSVFAEIYIDPNKSPMAAVREGYAALLAQELPISESELLERVQFIFSHPQLRTGYEASVGAYREALGDALRRAGFDDPLVIDVVAAAVVAASVAAIDRWQRQNGQPSLDVLLNRAFDALDEHWKA